MKRNRFLILITIVLLAGLTFSGTALALPWDPLPNLTAPSAPSNLTADAASKSEIDLTWNDNSDNETYFFIHRKLEGAAGYTTIANVGANVTSYHDSGLSASTKYYYEVSAFNTFGSSMSSQVSATTKSSILIPIFPIDPIDPIDPDIILPLLKPAAPSELEADAVSSSEIELNWTDNAANEEGFILERSMTQSSGYTEIDDLDADTTSYEDEDVEESITYFYRIKAYNDNGDSAYSALASAKTPAAESVTEPETPETPETPDTPPVVNKTILKFYINSDKYFVNDVTNFMDTSPINKDSRTLLPIRYVATPLGAEVGWDAATQKVTITLDDTVIQLWINKGTAMVNGIQTPIDENNSSVSPIIVPPGRTMLPLRFIAENLGCQVDWDQVSNEAKVTYPK